MLPPPVAAGSTNSVAKAKLDQLPSEILQLIIEFYLISLLTPDKNSSLGASQTPEIKSEITLPIYVQFSNFALICRSLKREFIDFLTLGFHMAKVDKSIRVPSWLAHLAKWDQTAAFEKPPIIRSLIFRPLINTNLLSDICKEAQLPIPNATTNKEYQRILLAAKSPVLMINSAKKVFRLLSEYIKAKGPFYSQTNELPNALKILERLLNNHEFSRLLITGTLKTSDIVNLKVFFGHILTEQLILVFLRNFELITFYHLNASTQIAVNLIGVIVNFRSSLKDETFYGRLDIYTKAENFLKSIKNSPVLKKHPCLLSTMLESIEDPKNNLLSLPMIETMIKILNQTPADSKEENLRQVIAGISLFFKEHKPTGELLRQPALVSSLIKLPANLSATTVRTQVASAILPLQERCKNITSQPYAPVVERKGSSDAEPIPA